MLAHPLSFRRRAQATVAPHTPRYVLQFGAVDRGHVALAGGKGASLGEMAQAGLPVPPGFVVSTEAFTTFAHAISLARRVSHALESLDGDDADAVQAASFELQELITSSEMPAEIEHAITEAYAALRVQTGATNNDGPWAPLRVAVRSSATSEDSAQHSFAGMFESYLNIADANAVVGHVRRCWASAFTPRVLAYRARHALAHDVPVAVVVQVMVDAEKSGVMFTADPSSGDRTRLVIEAAWGLGEAVVQGSVTPDHIEIEKNSLDELSARIARKEFLLEWNAARGATLAVDLADDPRATQPVLARSEIEQLAALAARAEGLYSGPQDMEFAIADGEVWLTQCRPITTIGRISAPVAIALVNEDEPSAVTTEFSGSLRGLAASPGVAVGRARVLESPSDAAALLAGEILITRMTTPDWVPTMRRAAAVVTDAGGMTSHAAIVARELGLPCVVGTGTATRDIPNGALIRVDGRAGTIVPDSGTEPVQSPPLAARSSPPAARSSVVTATRVYVNLAEPDRVDEIASRDVDGVGLLRAEFMLLAALEHMHPRAFLEKHGPDAFVERMRDQLLVFGRAFHPRPIIYRAMDFRSNEYRNLTGGAAHEPAEENPMIGYRGCFRYTREPDLFNLELRALAEARRETDNIQLMIPFVRTKWELEACLALVAQSPLGADRSMKKWIMAEVPSVVYRLPEYAALGIDGVSIGSNDLTQLMLGIDRDGERVAPLWDERDAAVLAAIEQIVTTCKRLGITCSICGQAPSVHADYAERLVRWGIDSVSVNPDAIDRTRALVAAAETRMLLEAARRSAC